MLTQTIRKILMKNEGICAGSWAKFPYLYDEKQEVAQTYDAQCTPDIFVYGTDSFWFTVELLLV